MNVFVATLLRLSYSGGFVILGVMILRLLLRGVPKQSRLIMWALAGLRLSVPLFVPSVFSIVPEPERLIADGGIIRQSSSFPTKTLIFTELLFFVWISGATAMIIYMIVSYLRLRCKVSENIPDENGMFVCDRIGSPFVLGILRPKIVVPSTLNDNEKRYVLLHERAHIKRLDTLWKPLAFLILSVHWFNPLVWLAYFLFSRDTELACDERAVKSLPLKERKEYSEVLLECSAKCFAVAACPFAFGEHPVKKRIESVLRYNKPKFYQVIFAVTATMAVVVFLLTTPVTARISRSLSPIQEPTLPVQSRENTFPTEEPTEMITEPPTEAFTQAPTENEEIEEVYEFAANDSQIYDEPYSYTYGEDSSGDSEGTVTNRWFEPQEFDRESVMNSLSLNGNGYAGSGDLIHNSYSDNNFDPYTDAKVNNVFQWDPLS